MFLRRRNIIAWALLLLASVCFAFARPDPRDTSEHLPTDSVVASSVVASSVAPTSDGAFDELTEPFGTLSAEKIEGIVTLRRALVFVLYFVSAGAAFAAVFILYADAPVLGPDGSSMLAASLMLLAYALLDAYGWFPGYFFRIPAGAIPSVFLLLCAVRELWGWVRARLSPAWCAVYRLCPRLASFKASLSLLLGWMLLSVGGLVLSAAKYGRYAMSFIPCGGFGVCIVSGLVAALALGGELDHFRRQLDASVRGQDVTVRDGLFAGEEKALADMKAQREEAVRTAVTSERFKVELISNVSHDLRTPLTSILGFGELLQAEPLSPEGREQLRLLNQKAGYMNDLVESLFELTKVSSGVLESKREEIDLIRLLEQTVGLFDDELRNAGLTVRRSYPADALPVVTDGARMHQVFANLLGNAVKYALKGTRIYLTVTQTDNSCVVRMVNTSSYEMDFEPEEIMQRFARGDKARSTKGSGLGLAIAQTYTQSVGGSFRVSVDGDQFAAIVELPKTERDL